MSVSISITAYSGKDSPEFQKHHKAVVFCIENGLSYPKETSEFFKGRISGDNLEDLDPKYILEKIKNGVSVDLKVHVNDKNYCEKRIKISEIPKEVDELIITLS